MPKGDILEEKFNTLKRTCKSEIPFIQDPGVTGLVSGTKKIERGRYIYTFENTCREEPDLTFGDDAYKVVVNTKGCRGEISEELMEAIRYLDDGSITGAYSRELDDAVKAVKASEERRLEYTLLVRI